MDSKTPVDLEFLKALFIHAVRSGTLNKFGELAIEWAEKADTEIARLRAENELLRKLLHEASDEIGVYCDYAWPCRDKYPYQMIKYDLDMGIVRRIEELIGQEDK